MNPFRALINFLYPHRIISSFFGPGRVRGGIKKKVSNSSTVVPARTISRISSIVKKSHTSSINKVGSRTHNVDDMVLITLFENQDEFDDRVREGSSTTQIQPLAEPDMHIAVKDHGENDASPETDCITTTTQKDAHDGPILARTSSNASCDGNSLVKIEDQVEDNEDGCGNETDEADTEVLSTSMLRYFETHPDFASSFPARETTRSLGAIASTSSPNQAVTSSDLVWTAGLPIASQSSGNINRRNGPGLVDSVPSINLASGFSSTDSQTAREDAICPARMVSDEFFDNMEEESIQMLNIPTNPPMTPTVAMNLNQPEPAPSFVVVEQSSPSESVTTVKTEVVREPETIVSPVRYPSMLGGIISIPPRVKSARNPGVPPPKLSAQRSSKKDTQGTPSTSQATPSAIRTRSIRKSVEREKSPARCLPPRQAKQHKRYDENLFFED